MANVKQFKQKTSGTLLDIEDAQARVDIASEVINRTNADKALEDKIKAETEARISADNEKQEKIAELNDKKITKFYASNLGETTLNDSDNGKIQDMMLFGKSEQKSYSGKNLLNPTLGTTTQSGVTITNNGDGTYTLNGTCSSIVTFVIANSANIDGNGSLKADVVILGGSYAGTVKHLELTKDYTGYRDVTIGTPHTLESGFVYKMFRIDIKEGAVFNNLLIGYIVADDVSSWEPYVGGIPSPNPDYPQEIESVVNPKVKVCGKNLIPAWYQGMISIDNGLTVTDNKYWLYTKEYTKIDKNKKYKFSSDTTCKACIYEYDVNKTLINFKQLITNYNTITYVPSSNCEYVRLGYNYNGGSEAITPSDMGVKHWLQLEVGEVATEYEPYKEQTATIPYTLNAIPVSSGGNVTIDGQQYIADYVDIEKKKLVRMVSKYDLSGKSIAYYAENYALILTDEIVDTETYIPRLLSAVCNKFLKSEIDVRTVDNIGWGGKVGIIVKRASTIQQEVLDMIGDSCKVYYKKSYPVTESLTDEEVQAFKELATHYPTTNVMVTSEQLDGYTTFNYPISLANGWNYVKEQLGDTRDYIYDMDLQSAEAYVNSEYAVTLTELEV